MAYWLVYQGSSFRRSRAGGYMWAPKVNRAGRSQVYWENMTRVQPGDTIFSGVDNAIRAVSLAGAKAYDAKRPDPRDEQHWDENGWRLDVTYTDLPAPLMYSSWVANVAGELRYRNSPFTETGRPNQGYFYELPDSVGEYILERSGDPNLVVRAAAEAPPPPGGETVRQAMIQARVGQGQFRKDLFRRWSGRCPLSGVSRPQLLRASHIKPWSSSNNYERLDPMNGLLLSAAYDAAFDALLVSFDEAGQLMLASDFDAGSAAGAGIDPSLKLPSADEGMKPYLQAHRELVHARVKRALSSI